MTEDADLVRRYQRGDAEAFAEFTRRHRDRVFRLARSWLYVGADVEDVVQEVFMRSLSGLTGFMFRAQPTTWLVRVTRNVCREANRRQRGHADIDDPGVQLALAERAHADGMAGLHSSATSVPGFDDDHQRVRHAVAALPARQREVVLLRIFEELSVADTAAALGCREGTVKAHLNKAVGNLRRLLSEAP